MIHPMGEPHKLWIDNCEAVEGIKERFGLEKAIGYLVGEKLANHIRLADHDPAFDTELPNFVKEIKRIFTPDEILTYFRQLRGLGAAAHVAGSDAEYRELRSLGMSNDDMLYQAKDVLLAKRMRALLLDNP